MMQRLTAKMILGLGLAASVTMFVAGCHYHDRHRSDGYYDRFGRYYDREEYRSGRRYDRDYWRDRYGTDRYDRDGWRNR
jgi:hypothetical protein